MSTIDDDDTLAAPAPVQVVDSTTAPDVEDFDWDAFLVGVRPTRRSVKIYPRADLIGVMEQVAAQIDEATTAAAKRPLRERFDALREQFESSAQWFTVERRSQDWIEKVRADVAARLGVDLDAEDVPTEHRITATLERLAGQIVVPSGVTVDGLRQLMAANEGELNKLIVAMTMAQSNTAESAKVLSRDFSPAPSAKTARPGSKRR